MKRRELLSLLSQLGLLSTIPDFWLSSSLAEAAPLVSKNNKKTLLLIFQRGAADGLSMCVPYGDTNFNKSLRPQIRPDDAKLIKLNGYFGLNPGLASFKTLWDRGVFNVIHQVGSPSSSRSHFDSQDYFETGTPDVKMTETGFLTRAAHELKNYDQLKLAALSIQPNLPRSIGGEKKSLSFDNLNSFSIKGLAVNPAQGQGFEDFFDSAVNEVFKGQTQTSVGELLADFEKIRNIKLSQTFAKNQIGRRLQDIAKLIKSGEAPPFIVTEMGGWDTHVNQGSDKGRLANNLEQLSTGLLNFVDEIGERIADVTILTVTEFGRTVKENGSAGTDHGHGSCYFVMNGNLKRQSVLADWKPLKNENLFEGRDLPVTTDYRDVLAEILRTQFGVQNFAEVFPNYGVKRFKLYG